MSTSLFFNLMPVITSLLSEQIIMIAENHVIVGELLETKAAQQVDLNTPKSIVGDSNWNPNPEASHDTGGYGIGFSLTVLQIGLLCL